MDEFVKEDRYLVLKNKNIQDCLTETEQEILDALVWKIKKHRVECCKPPLNCVVVESDWKPEYEQTWELIKNRVKHHTEE